MNDDHERMIQALEEIETTILEVADHINDAVDADQPIYGSATVDPLMEAHGALCEVVANLRRRA